MVKAETRGRNVRVPAVAGPGDDALMRAAIDYAIAHGAVVVSIADNLSKAGWSLGCISSTDHEGRQFWVAAAERENAGRFIVRADEKLTAFVELESATRATS